MDNPFNDIKELYQQEQHRRKQEEEKIKRDQEKQQEQQAEENKKIAEKTSQRFSQFRKTVNDLSPMIDKILCQFGDQVWGFTNKTDYEYEQKWYGRKEIPHNYEIKNYAMKDWECIADGLIYIRVRDDYGDLQPEKLYLKSKYKKLSFSKYGSTSYKSRQDISRPSTEVYKYDPITIDINGNTHKYSTKIDQLHSHYLYSYIFRHDEAYLVAFCQQFHENIDIVKCTGLIVASAIAEQYGDSRSWSYESATGGGTISNTYWGVKFEIQREKLITCDESSLIEALKELFKLQHQL